MNTRQLSQAIAQRLPERTQDQVDEFLAAFAEIVETELSQPEGYIYLRGFGKLHVEHQIVQPSGIFASQYQPGKMFLRLYFRFDPTHELKEFVRAALGNIDK